MRASMKTSRFLAVVLTAILSFGAVQAAQYGSETRITLRGAFRITDTEKTSRPGGGVTRVRNEAEERKISNATVLAEMVKEGLIPRIKDYFIVMVGQPRMADGVTFFAVRDGVSPVEIPASILKLEIEDGAEEGVIEETGARLTRLNMHISSYATLTINKFVAGGSLDQWLSMKTVDNVGIELVEGGGIFIGKAPTKKDGVGLVELGFSKSRTVRLSRYGISDGDFGGGGGGDFGGSSSTTLVKTGAGALSLGGSSWTDVMVTQGTLTLAPSTFELANGSTLTVNSQLVAPGLSVAFDGTLLPIYTFGSNLANELTLNTSDGPVVYTRESGDVWTLVVPEVSEEAPGEPAAVE